MDLLDKQLKLLNDEVRDLATKIDQLYDKLDSMQDPSLGKELKERIDKLETEMNEVNARREMLEDKLQPVGMPIKG